jgi:hypothetical protein
MWGRWRRYAALVGAVAVPLLVAVVALADDDWHPTGDMAQAELHVRGFFPNPPLLGAAGRLGTLTEQGSHPGPAAWAALLPGYRLLGQSGWALGASVAAVALGWAAACVAVARRRGGWPLAAITTLGLVVLVRANGPEVFTEPWNPWLAVLPFAAFVLLVWSVLCDDRAALAWAVVAGSYALQCHVGYALLVGGLGLLATAWAVRRRWWRPLAAAAAAGAVLWLPPVVEQLTADDAWPGNIRILYDHFSEPDEDTVGLGAAVDAFAGELNVAGPWLVGEVHQPTDPPAWAGFAAMAALWVGAAAVARRRRLDGPPRLHAVLAAACVLGVASMARVFGDFFDYVIRWMWVLAALVAVATAWTAWEAAPARRRRRGRPRRRRRRRRGRCRRRRAVRPAQQPPRRRAGAGARRRARRRRALPDALGRHGVARRDRRGRPPRAREARLRRRRRPLQPGRRAAAPGDRRRVRRGRRRAHRRRAGGRRRRGATGR